MGLDISCKCGKIDFRAGSYSGFHIWRRRLAKLGGVDLDEMVGFSSDCNCNSQKWTKEEPFYELLDHSDCEASLTPKKCKELQQDFNYFENYAKKLWFEPMQNWDFQRFMSWKGAIEHSINKKCTLEFR